MIMKFSLKTVFILSLMLMALLTSLSATPPEEELVADHDNSEEASASLHGISRFLTQETTRRKFAMTCNRYPRVCRVPGSPGPDCCKKKCVNVFTDRFNCGMCGKKCKYSEICCRGKCVNPMKNKRHCGRCNKRCQRNNVCVYGMCSYA